MDVARMEEILRKEYGIQNRNEFEAAASRYGGLDIGIFITPIADSLGVRKEKRNA